jgi:ABC-type multidrug transport system ATPase subunit
MAIAATAVRPGRRGAAGAVLECRGLRKTFGDLVAVRDIGFSVSPGETYGLLGPNGAGKTTTISMVAGLLEPDAGEVLLDGQPMTTRTVGLRGLVGYVPQELAIYPTSPATRTCASSPGCTVCRGRRWRAGSVRSLTSSA